MSTIAPGESPTAMNHAPTSISWYADFNKMNGIVFVIGTLLLGISHFLHESGFSINLGSSVIKIPEFLEFFTKEAGVAAYVALCLNLSTEWVNRAKHDTQQNNLLRELEERRLVLLDAITNNHSKNSEMLIDKVSRHLLKAVYERNIPEEIFKQVEKHLLNRDEIRKAYKASYTITRFTDCDFKFKNMFVKLDGYYEYTLENISQKPIDTKIKVCIDLIPGHEQHCKFSSVTIDKTYYSGQKLLEDKFVEQDENGSYLLLEVPLDLRANESKKISITYTKLGRADDCEIVCATAPMLGMTLEIVVPDKDFTVDAMSLHPEDVELTSANGRKEKMEWKLNSILPGQGMSFFWRPINGANSYTPNSKESQ